VQNDTTPIFKGMGPERMAILVVSSIFSVCFAFFWTFRCLNSNLKCGYITYPCALV
jgi:hypothetical protein